MFKSGRAHHLPEIGPERRGTSCDVGANYLGMTGANKSALLFAFPAVHRCIRETMGEEDKQMFSKRPDPYKVARVLILAATATAIAAPQAFSGEYAVPKPSASNSSGSSSSNKSSSGGSSAPSSSSGGSSSNKSSSAGSSGSSSSGERSGGIQFNSPTFNQLKYIAPSVPRQERYFDQRNKE